jgi:hypothetical protein
MCVDSKSLEESFETVLANHEDECNDFLVCAKFETFHWTSVSREKLAFYAALLYSRATQRKTSSAKQWTKILSELREATTDELLIREIADAIGRQFGVVASVETVQKAIANYIQKSETPEEAKNSFLSSLIQNTESIASLLLKKEPWRILRPPLGLQFVTTDNPLITFVPLGNGLLHPGYGFGKEIADAAFPLAPDACLLMGKAWNVARTLEGEMLAHLNEAFISICDKYVYSKTMSDEVNEMVQKYAGTCRYGESAFMPIGLKLPSARAFLRMQFNLGPE